MPIVPHQPTQTQSKRAARVLVTIWLLASVFSACDRLAGTNQQNIALVQRHFDSLAAADTNFLQRTASQDSLFAIREVQRRTDSIIRQTQPDLAPAPPVSAVDASTGAVNAPAPRSSVAAAPNPGAAGATPVTSATSNVPVNPRVAADVQARLSRAQALGDSLANAKVNQIVGQNRATSAGDTVRGLVQMNGTGAASRPELLVDRGRATVSLTGMAVEGLVALSGAEVTVRGMRVSPRDIVVSAFAVRAVNGFPVLDGQLSRGEKGGWNLALSDKSGTRTLASIPEALQVAIGARIWIDVSNGARPQTYGIIARR